MVFTLPYLATQPMGAGILLETLSGGEIEYHLLLPEDLHGNESFLKNKYYLRSVLWYSL